MSFRRRIAIVSAAAVAIAVLLASLLTYVLTSNQLHKQVDSQLRDRGREARGLRRFEASTAAKQPARSPQGTLPQGELGKLGARGSAPTQGNPLGGLSPTPGQVRGYQQLVLANGTIVVKSSRGVSLPVDGETRLLAARGGPRASATRSSTASTSGSSPSPSAPVEPSSSPSPSPKPTASSPASA